MAEVLAIIGILVFLVLAFFVWDYIKMLRKRLRTLEENLEKSAPPPGVISIDAPSEPGLQLN